VWQEFETLDRMAAWYGTGHTLTRYEPYVGGIVETDAGSAYGGSAGLVFRGRVLVFEPCREITFEQDWLGHGWNAPALVTIRLTPLHDGTLVELFHHGFEAASDTPGIEFNGFEGGWDDHHFVALHKVMEAAPLG
jgi:uncharacterized protein YndB with AHSA1/START domain